MNTTREFVLLFLVLAIGIFARFYHAGNFPYGIEGDESKWGLQAFYSVILQVHQGIFGHHFEHQPVSFHLIGLAMRLLGIDLMTPRYLNAFLSSLSLVFFYFGLRQATGNKPVALTATFLYAMSFIALSAGRQALHGSYIEVWINIAFWSLVYGLDYRKVWAIAITGITLALGSLTYETFYPILGVFIIYALIRIWPSRHEKIFFTKMLLSLIIPVALIIPTTINYINDRSGYHFGGMKDLTASSHPQNPWIGGLLALGHRLIETLQSLFVSLGQPDALLRWTGPIVSPWILPFFVAGLITTAYHYKHKHNLLLLLWFVFAFFGFSLLGAGSPRVLFAAIMPIYALAGLGLIMAYRMARSLSFFSSAQIQKLLKSAFIVLLLLIAFVDVKIFSTSLDDLGDRKQRRELYDTFLVSMESSSLSIIPYKELANNATYLEKEVLEMLAQKQEDRYRIIPIQEVLFVFWLAQEQAESISLIIEKPTIPGHDPFADAILPILSCYTDYSKTEGRYFVTYLFANIDNPQCFSLPPPKPITPTRGQIFQPSQTVTFQWDSEQKQVGYEITIQSLEAGLIRLEAEDMQADGWYQESHHATDYSGSGYLTDNFMAGLAQTSFDIKAPGNYTLWVRTYRRVINDQVNYLSMNQNEPVKIARGSEETFNTWVWEKVGSYDLQSGTHTITANRTYGKDPQYSVFLDMFVLSSNPDYHPETSDAWNTIISVQLDDASKNSYTHEPSLPEGKYRWWLSYIETPGLVNWLGNSETSTTPIEFRVESSP